MEPMVRIDRSVRGVRKTRPSVRRWAAFLLVLGLLLPAVVVLPGIAGAGAPLYPDLTTAAPQDLSISTQTIGGVRHYVLRFSTQVENRGAGRLEIVVGSGSARDVYQNVYDAKVGGMLVAHTRIGADIIFHPTHNHFHFNDFAEATLLKKDASGAYVNSGKIGKKSSFCILDYIKVLSSASTAVYSSCQPTRQGLSVGWADIYYASLAEQYVDLGTTTLANGEYALRITADPLNKLAETNNGNNMGVAYFRVSNGQITSTAAPPTCSLSPASGPQGTVVGVLCSLFPPGQTVDLFWESPNGSPVTTVTADVSGVVRGNVPIPSAALGVHYIVTKARGSTTSVPTVFQVTPGQSLTPSSGIVGSNVIINVTGFAAGETVDFRFYKTSAYYNTLTSAPASSIGSATGTLVVPSTPYGEHRIEAYGKTSKKKVSTTYSLQPSLVLLAPSGAAGASVKPSGRGFGASEQVHISIETSPGNATVLKTVTSASTGSISATSSTAFVIPTGLPPGSYPIVARGLTTGATVSVPFTLTGSGASVVDEEPTPTNTPEPTETSVPPTATPPLPTSTPPPPTETPAPTATDSPTATPTATETVEATPTDTPPPTATTEPSGPTGPTMVSVTVMDTGDTFVRLSVEATGAQTIEIEYGLDATYGEVVSEETEDGETRIRLRRLSPGVTYHYRATAIGPGGRASTEDATFTTDS